MNRKRRSVAPGWWHRTFFYGRTLKECWLTLFFALSMVLKAIDGLIELAVGVVFAALPNEKILSIFLNSLYRQDIVRVPSDMIIRWTNHLAQLLYFEVNFHSAVSIILIGNGAVKIFIGVVLLMRKFFFFPLILTFLTALYLYQIIQTIHYPSMFLYVSDVIDLVVLLLVGFQYHQLRNNGS
jgi:uncharacterized membrane protein